MKRRILAFLLCFFSIFTLCGCGSIRYYIQIDSASGVITQGVVFSVSQSDIESSGKDVGNFKSYVEAAANTVVSQSFSNFESAHEADEMMTTYDGEQVSYAQIVAWTEQHIDPVTKRPQIIWQTNGDTLTCSIALRFLSVYAYLYFYDSFPDTEEEDNIILEQHLFYVKRITEQTSPFANLETDTIANYFISYFDGYFNFSDMTYSFAYSTPDEKMHSDADVIETVSSGNHVHIWNWTAEQLAQNGGKFHTYTIKIKTPVWYMFGIIVGLTTGLVLWLVCKKKEKPKPNNNQVVGDEVNIDTKE